MRTQYIVLIAVAVALFPVTLMLTRFGHQTQTTPLPESLRTLMAGKRFNVVVKDLENCGVVPVRYTCDSPNPTPPTVRWEGVEGAKSYVLIVADPDAPIGTFYHLIAYDITSNSWPSASILLPNSAGYPGWFPVCPPRGDKPHHYYFIVYAVNEMLPKVSSLGQLLEAMKGHVVGWGVVCGIYQRK